MSFIIEAVYVLICMRRYLWERKVLLVVFEDV